VRNVTLNLLTAESQEAGSLKPSRMTIGEALDKGLVSCETMGYFLVRIHDFLMKVGISAEFLRFRQHMNTEMAHYACDCWDAEALTSYGWVEIVGCADRSCYDLEKHAEASKTVMMAEETLAEPKIVDVVTVILNKGKMGKAFKKDAKIITQHFATMEDEAKLQVQATLEAGSDVHITCDEKEFTIPMDMIEVKKSKKTIHVERYVPSVIEPAFGIGRIMYCALEHSYYLRSADDEKRSVFRLPANIAPVKCILLALSNSQKERFDEFTDAVSAKLAQRGVVFRVDNSSAAIGRRYSRADEIGIPYAISLDFATFEDQTVTVRERDSTKQVRCSIEDAVAVVDDLSRLTTTWADVTAKYPLFDASA